MTIVNDWYNKKLTCQICGTTKSVKYETKNGKPTCNKCILLHAGDCDELSIQDIVVKALAENINIKDLETYHLGSVRGVHLWNQNGKWFEIEIKEVK